MASARVDGGGEGSLNHYSKGAVVSFLHRYVAGLRVPAYRRFAVRPRPGGGITAAEARLDTPTARSPRPGGSTAARSP